MKEKKLYSTTEVAALANVSRDTILRWLKDGKIPEPNRNRNRWRIFSEEDLKAVLRYANKVIPGPKRVQRDLFKQRQRS